MATDGDGVEMAQIPTTRDRGYVPVTSHGQTIMNTARNRDLVIECTGASGVTHSFVHTGVMDLWAATRDSLDSAWLVDPSTEETIENCIRRCDPDVRLVEESISTFGDGGSD